MKRYYTLMIFLLIAVTGRAQTIDSIFVNLYTDSLKTGTHNYINVDGLLSNGKYIPLDSTHLLFSSSAGWFSGNSLVLDKQFKGEKVNITVTLRGRSLEKHFTLFVKKKPDDEKLPTAEEVMKRKRKKSGS